MTVPAAAGEIRCSFCAKEEREVSKIIAGPGIYICDGCVARCNDILEQDRQPDRPQLLAWESMTDQELLDHLPRVAAVGEQVEANLRQWVLRAHDRGVRLGPHRYRPEHDPSVGVGRFSGED